MDLYAGLLLVGVGDVAYLIGMDLTVVKLYAVGNALHILFGNGLVGPYMVDFLLDVLGMGELRGQVAVVGE